MTTTIENMVTTIENLYDIFQQYPNISTDTRKVTEGTLFFALKGGNFDGNQYANQALEKGAAYAVVDDLNLPQNDRFLLVEDVLKTLQDLARFHRRRFGIPLIALTGSNGKTTTKELISSVLSFQYQAHYTKGNFNNHIGVPLTLLAMPKETQVAIIEMGANHIGEIEELCHIAEPTHGLITNIGKAHLEGFGSLEGVKQTKSELYRFLEKNDGVVFINMDEPFLTELAAENSRKVFYKEDSNLDTQVPPKQITFLGADPFVKAAFIDPLGERYEVQTKLIGSYNFPNIMTAIALAKYFRVPPLVIKTSLENYAPTNNRSQIIQQDSNTYILDAYNANPTSMDKALENFAGLTADKKVAILGDMLELGIESQAEHQKVFDKVQHLGFQQVCYVGKEFGKITQTQYWETVQDLKQWFIQQNFENTYFLIKGSRGIKLEQVLQV